jgi:hypothetical protein
VSIKINYKFVAKLKFSLRKEKEAALEREMKLEEEKLWAQVNLFVAFDRVHCVSVPV